MWEAGALLAVLVPLSFGLSQGSQSPETAIPSSQAAGVKPADSQRELSEALHAAVRAGNVKQAAELIDAGADVNSLDALGGTPLLTASWSGRADLVALLLSRGAAVNATHREAGSSALEYAVLTTRPDIIKLLLASGADVHRKRQNSETVLHLAASRGSPPVLELLLEAGADITATDDSGNSPLDEAVLHDRTDAVRTLLAHGAELNHPHPADGRGVLHEACMKGFPDMVELLISKGANPVLSDRFGQTPLDLALAYKNPKVIALMLQLGGSVSESQAAIDRAMESATLKGQVDIVQALLNGGFDVNRPTANGSTYLHDAALNNQKKIAQLLLKRGAKIYALNRSGGTPLHDAALGGGVDVIAELLDRGANIDAQDTESGATPLMLAVAMERIPAARLLLKRGANTRITDHLGNTALDRARKTDDLELVNLLKNPSAPAS